MPPIVVAFDQPVARVFVYLTDPVNRPAWQASLRSVVIEDPGPPHVGQRWTDVTAVGLRPRMRTVELDPGVRWTEEGRWRGMVVRATLEFAATGAESCTVTMTVGWGGVMPVRVAGGLVGALGRPALAADLKRASGLLRDAGTGE